MASDETELDFEEPQQPKALRSRNYASRIFLAFVVLMLLSLTGVVVVAARFGKATGSAPDVVTALAREMTTIEIPSELAPERWFTFHIVFWRWPKLEWVRFADSQTNSSLVLAQVQGDYEQWVGRVAEYQAQVEQSLEEQGIRTDKINIEQRSSTPLNARDQQIICNCFRGKDPRSKRWRIHVACVFYGRHGTGLLLLYADAQRFTEEKIFHMIQSLHSGD